MTAIFLILFRFEMKMTRRNHELHKFSTSKYCKNEIGVSRLKWSFYSVKIFLFAADSKFNSTILRHKVVVLIPSILAVS